VKRFVSLHFIILKELVGFLERGNQPIARPLHNTTDIHASSGIRTHNPSVRAGEQRNQRHFKDILNENNLQGNEKYVNLFLLSSKILFHLQSYIAKQFS
jgi:hypothetical protein